MEVFSFGKVLELENLKFCFLTIIFGTLFLFVYKIASHAFFYFEKDFSSLGHPVIGNAVEVSYLHWSNLFLEL
jgi:hypothetical protein